MIFAAICVPACAHGTCAPTNTCVCDPDWTGTRCRIGKYTTIIVLIILSTDIDECAANSNICHHSCNNTEGSYTCYCVPGYELLSDNATCRGTVTVIKKEHYFVIDINECETDYHGCSHSCSNTNGSYICYCRKGYSYIGNGECVGKDRNLLQSSCKIKWYYWKPFVSPLCYHCCICSNQVMYTLQIYL